MAGPNSKPSKLNRGKYAIILIIFLPLKIKHLDIIVLIDV